MDYRSLVNKLEAIQAGTYISEATAPTQFKPTHFHKGNLGNENPVMQTPDGAWWHEASQSGEGGGYAIVPWQGDTKNRSKWNPASIDGIYVDGKPVPFPEGVTWDTYKPAEVAKPAPAAEVKPAADTTKKPVAFGDADRAAADMKKLDDLTKQLLASGAAPATIGQGAARTDGPANRDAMPFGKAFADARAKGEKTFMWKGKSYTTELAKSGGGAMPSKGNQIGKPANDTKMPDVDIMGNVTGMQESASIKNSLIESFGYQTEEVNVGQAKNVMFKEPPGAAKSSELAFSQMVDQLTNKASAVDKVATQAGTSAAEKAAGAVAGDVAKAAGGKMLKKALPVIGTAYGAYDAINRAKKGDYTGAGIAAASTAAGMIPGPGTAAMFGLDAMNLARDYKRGEFNESSSENIGNLRNKLLLIESKEVINESTPGDIFRAGREFGGDAIKGVKNFFKGVGSPTVTPLPNAGKATNVKYKGPSGSFKAGQAVGRNPGTATATAVGAGAGFGFGGPDKVAVPGATDQIAKGKDNSGQGGNPSGGAGGATGTTADQQSIIDQMNEIIARYNGDGADDEILSHIVPAQNAIVKVTGTGSQTEFTPAVKEQSVEESNELARWLKIAHG